MSRLRFAVLLAVAVCLDVRAATTAVSVNNFAFSQATVFIQPGDKVQWTWGSGVHSVTSDTGLWTDTGLRSAPFTFSFTFNTTGSFRYYCTLHGAAGGVGMSGMVVVSYATTTSLTTSKTPTVIGEGATLTATVTPNSATALVPSGAVTFKDNTVVMCSGVPLDGSATATCSTASLGIGSHSITAQYGGDANFSNSNSSPLLQTVTKASTTTSLMSSKNPATLCDNITFTATPAVVAPGSVAGPITGSVTFSDGGNVLCSTTLSAGSAQCNASLALGTHNITASYGGNTQLNGSTSSPPLVETIQTVAVAAPASFAATAQSSTTVRLEWPAVAGASGYEVGRRAVRTDADTIIAVPSACTPAVSYFDAAPNLDKAYIYRVRAIGSNVSDWSNPDVAMTFYFANRPALNGPIGATDMADLRHAMNLVHAAAGYVTDIAFTNDPLTANVSAILALDLLELRHALTDAFGLISVAPPAYTDSDETALQNQAVPVKALHFTELQDAVQ